MRFVHVSGPLTCSFLRLRARHSAQPPVTQMDSSTQHGVQTAFLVWHSRASLDRMPLLSSSILSMRVFYLPIPSVSAPQSCTLVELTETFTRVTSPMYLSHIRCGCAKSSNRYINDHTIQSYWQTTVDALSLNGQPIAGATNLNAIVDSGTAMILGDRTTVQAFYSQIPGSSIISPGNSEYYSCKLLKGLL